MICLEELEQASWENCFSNNDINDITDSWTSTCLNIAHECIPNKVVKIYPNDKPFYTSAQSPEI